MSSSKVSPEDSSQQPTDNFERQLGYTALLSLSSGVSLGGGAVLASEGHPWLGTATMISPLITVVASKGLTRVFTSNEKTPTG